ncbi:TPA: hypothetical protein HNO25_21270, partial [Escherichia coli]|nr:hypothetical protein [Escherichia coli]
IPSAPAEGKKHAQQAVTKKQIKREKIPTIPPPYQQHNIMRYFLRRTLSFLNKKKQNYLTLFKIISLKNNQLNKN